MISETTRTPVNISTYLGVSVRLTCVERNDACGAPKGKDYTSLLHVSHVPDKDCSGATYQYNIRECKEEERPLKILPVCRLVLRLIIPQSQLLQELTLFVSR